MNQIPISQCYFTQIQHTTSLLPILILWIDGDLSTREHSLLFDNEETEASFMLEVVDDNIAENNEIFIIYTSVIEDPEDNCARAVLLRDNDSEKN